MKNKFKNKIILVTGGTGMIGSELVTQLLKYEPRQIRVYSRNETSQYYLREKLGANSNVRMLIGDVRDKSRLEFAIEGVDIVFHAAAMKENDVFTIVSDDVHFDKVREFKRIPL